MIIKWSIQPENITIKSVYVPNIRVPKYISKYETERRNRQQYINSRRL